jgi:carboxypeptidase Taq
VDPRFDELRRRLAEISDLGRARALLAWDERTQMPPGGAEARAEHLSTLARVRHERLASDELGRLLEGLEPEVGGLPYEADERSLVRVARRDWGKARRVPAELRAEMTRTASLAERAWVEAKGRSDFAAFLPHLERTVELRRRYAECFAPFDHPYDPLLDDFEEGMTTAAIRPLLTELRDGLRPLLAAIEGRGERVDDSCLHGTFPIEAQAALATRIVAGLPLEQDEWRLDPTVHPFATAISPSDIRITTRYDQGYIGASVWAVIHEAGHGMYENGLPAELARSPLCRATSLGWHESQSRLWENWVGRGRPYLRHLHPVLVEAFPDSFAGIDPESLYRAANRVEPTLIRMEADEITYNLHIAIRFELELEIVEERLELRDLPEAWNARYAEYLGIDVPDDERGVLQDVHWAAGSFGYFPTYSLGNVIAGQLWELARAALPDLDDMLERGEPAPLRDWLRENVYRLGGKLEPLEMIERVAGGPLDVGPLLGHLRAKYGEIYELD